MILNNKRIFKKNHSKSLFVQKKSVHKFVNINYETQGLVPVSLKHNETLGMAPVSLNQEENMTVAGTAKLLLFTNEQGKTNNNCC